MLREVPRDRSALAGGLLPYRPGALRGLVSPFPCQAPNSRCVRSNALYMVAPVLATRQNRWRKAPRVARTAGVPMVSWRFWPGCRGCKAACAGAGRGFGGLGKRLKSALPGPRIRFVGQAARAGLPPSVADDRAVPAGRQWSVATEGDQLIDTMSAARSAVREETVE